MKFWPIYVYEPKFISFHIRDGDENIYIGRAWGKYRWIKRINSIKLTKNLMR